MSIARTPEPPYTAVIFTSVRTGAEDGYATMARRMEELAAEHVIAQERGRTLWYADYQVRVARVERSCVPEGPR